MVGPDGRIVGVDLTDAMLERAQNRVATHGWRNVSLVQSDAVDFDFPTDIDAIVSTYALTQVPDCAEVIAHGAAALSPGGHWVVLDLKVPANVPRRLAQLGTAVVRPFASIDDWMMRRPWEAIRAAMQEELADLSWTELLFGTAFLAAGSGVASSRRRFALLGQFEVTEPFGLTRANSTGASVRESSYGRDPSVVGYHEG